MKRSICSVGLVLITFVVSGFSCGEARADGQYWAQGPYQGQYQNQYFDPARTDFLFMESGISHGKAWGKGAIAVKFGSIEDAVCPSRVNGYMTKTRHGFFTTIR